ncbi:EF-hand calcium-binding domain-containing protein 7 isoform X1 [Perca flavescens]|uniref:EF-hand calcium-binding domain-containing protein 7 isoform X1 n=1 Tax=Perca flavescens TaxID=8167 RepID=UPI00106ECA86|nr:EF-hand calcium-binding domain-containing protein 7 isoform X1 [Perca flavescens]XP_028443613.1 EF-hand calcium-binding domain-containing protein 7 isoform X1 [Perca flavescens]
MSSQELLRPADEEEAFYVQCRAAYLAVFRSSLTYITSKQQLCRALQQAGRNPTNATLNKYWTQRTSKLNFDDFCEILKNEKRTEETELMRAFKKMDVNSDGYISHSELEKALTTKGEKMTPEEVNAIFSLADINKDGKLDYAEFCRLLVSTAEQCQMAALERLDANAKLKRQNFGSQSYSPPKSSVSPASSAAAQAAATLSQPPESDTALKKESRSSSRLSSARSRRSSLSNSITVTSSSTKGSKIPEPSGLQEWHHSYMKGCFFLEDDGSIGSLQYQLHVPQTANIYLTIQPLSFSHGPGTGTDKPSSWMTVDTALFVMSAGEIREESTLVCFTESKDKEKYVWKGELHAGTYYLLPFTSGCKLKKRSKKSLSDKPLELIYRTDTGELDLTRELREVLSDIFEVIDLDGNGLLSLEEYNLFELRTSGEKCDKDAWAVCKENFDMRKNQLTKQGFMELNLMEATEKDGDPADLWVTLEAMGYNRMLELVEACPFQIDVHCEGTQPSIQPLSMDSGPKLLIQALQKSITARTGAKALRGQDNVFIYTYRGEHRISSLIANKANQKVTVHVNNEQSRNCCSSRGMSVFAVEVPARTKMVCQHILPINERQDWTYNCVETILPC